MTLMNYNFRPSFDYLMTRDFADHEVRLQTVRNRMTVSNLTAILVLMDDVGRLAWISGFTGSAGSAIITMEKVKI